jgi:hypothetical protein
MMLEMNGNIMTDFEDPLKREGIVVLQIQSGSYYRFQAKKCCMLPFSALPDERAFNQNFLH